MIDRILTNGTVIYKIPEATPSESEAQVIAHLIQTQDGYCYPGTELSDTLRSLDCWIEDVESGTSEESAWSHLDACLSWIYFRTCSIELPEETVALYLSDEEWDMVNKGVTLNSRYWINFNRES